MSRSAYGRTWWGAQWLQALAEIDHDNRLPRGRSYARNGSVRDLVVQGSRIKARVKGSRPQAYAVDIEVPPIAPAAAARLAGALAADPVLIARLLNRELDPAVLTQARELGVPVFPTRWSDLKMHCSCPDWAVPCKHIAAVIYLLSQEIDGDPFLVFRLRGVDLGALLGRQGALVRADADIALPKSVLALMDEPAPPPPAAGAAHAQNPRNPQNLQNAQHARQAAVAEAATDAANAAAPIDFTTLPDLRDALWRLLPAAPVFVHGADFRETLRKAIARLAREARSRLDAPPGMQDAAADTAADPANDAADDAADDPSALPAGQLQFIVDARGALTLTGLSRAGVAVDTLTAALQLLATTPPARLADLPAGLAELNTFRGAALHLLAQGAVVPQVLAPDKTLVALRWCAAEGDERVRALVAQLGAALPAELMLQRQARTKALQPSTLAAVTRARLLLSACIDLLWRGLARGTEAGAGDKVTALFFGAGHVRFDGPGEGAVVGSVAAWLSRLHLARQTLRPVLRIDESQAEDAFELSLAVADERQPLQAPTPLAEVLTQPHWAAERPAVLRTVAMLAELHPPLHEHLRSGARRPLAVAAAALPALLFEVLPALRLMGVRTLLPRALDRLWRPRLSLQVKASSSSVPSLLQADAIFSFDWKVAVGEQLLTPAEFERLLGTAQGVVRFRGEYVMLDPAEVEALRARLARPGQPGGADLLRAALAGDFEGAPVGLNKAAAQIVERLRSEPEVPLPQGLRATLRPYQRRGYAWLWRNTKLGLGSVIADDMGLGKTLQVLALLLRLKEDGALAEGRALVIVPTSLLTNWQRETARFTPGLSVDVFHGSRRELAARRPDVLLTTYGVARSEAALLKAMPWRVVVVDEAQNIKNPAAAQARAVKAIAAPSHIAMSGTPVENRLSEYWSIMDFAQPGYLGGLPHFTREYATPIQTDRDAAAAERLRRVMAPFMLRRLKSDKTIIDDLPDKIEQDQHCTLTREQAALYETVVRAGLDTIAGTSDTFRRQGLVLQMILALKQVCNHPAQYLKAGAAEAAASGKAQRLLDLLDEVEAAQGKALVFTQFREMGELLLRMLRERPAPGGAPRPEALFLHGGVPRAKRDQMVERFQHEPGQRVFILSLKAGGTGLNLTAANQVIHFDLWWNPAVEAQATDRAYRIGQQRQVQVHRLITQGTFEERINAMIQSKRELAEMTVGSGETWIGQLPPAELKALFELTR